jgi:hypothetical protein
MDSGYLSTVPGVQEEFAAQRDEGLIALIAADSKDGIASKRRQLGTNFRKELNQV